MILGFWSILSRKHTHFSPTLTKKRGEGAPSCAREAIQMIDVQERDGAAIFPVRVQPRASKDEIAGEMSGALKVRLRAPAVEDRANDALVEFLAQLLKTPKSAVRILSGDRSRTKRIEIRGVTGQQIQALLAKEA